MLFTKRLILIALVACLVGTLAGCGGGGGGGGSRPVAALPTAVAGTWMVDWTMGDNPCDPAENGLFLGTETVVFRQSGSTIELHRENGELLASGTIDLDDVVRLSLANEPESKVEFTVTPSTDLLAFTLTGFSEELTDNCAEKIRMELDGIRFSLSTDFRLPACISEEITVDQELVVRSTEGLENSFESTCTDPNGSGPDDALLFTAPIDARYFVGIDASFESVLTIYADDCVTELDCAGESVEVDLAKGERIVVVIDGFEAGEEGTYVLQVTPADSCWTGVVGLGTQTVSLESRIDETGGSVFLFEAPATSDYVVELETDPREATIIIGDHGCDEFETFAGSEVTVSLQAGQRIVIAFRFEGGPGSGELPLTISPMACWREVAQLGVNPGTTADESDDFTSCGGAGGLDIVYVFVAPANGYYTIDAVDSSFFPTLAVRGGDCEDLIECHDEANTGPNDVLALFLETGDQIVIVVDSSNGESGEYNLTIDLDVHYRVNCGGNVIEDQSLSGPAWTADTNASPSPFVNAEESGSGAATHAATAMVDPTVPTSMPLELFSSNRHDPPAGDEMKWSFPVPNGAYEVRLGFAEMYSGASDTGERVFSVHVEGEAALEDFDQAGELGFQVATLKTFTIEATDGSVDIEFLRDQEHPNIKSIEIVPSADSPDEEEESEEVTTRDSAL